MSIINQPTSLSSLNPLTLPGNLRICPHRPAVKDLHCSCCLCQGHFRPRHPTIWLPLFLQVFVHISTSHWPLKITNFVPPSYPLIVLSFFFFFPLVSLFSFSHKYLPSKDDVIHFPSICNLLPLLRIECGFHEGHISLVYLQLLELCLKHSSQEILVGWVNKFI